jgi:extracellular factor (EF) 3-hydroxypalmitic acid methyl ester biosynthesis protein
MDEREIELQGYLEKDGARIAITAAYASRLSLFVNFNRGEEINDGIEFNGLVLNISDQEVEFSKCRFYSERTHKGFMGLLIFIDDVYDFKNIIFNQKFVNIQTSFNNLPLVLSQKDQIKDSFKNYTSKVVYDFAVYKYFFDDLDRKYVNESKKVRQIAQEILIKKEGGKFMQFFDSTLKELEGEIADFDKKDHQSHGFYFRKQVWEFILGSEFLRRTNLKPRGYVGDSQMIFMCYENDYRGNFVFNKLIHKHPLETEAGHAVRNRRIFIPQVLRRVQKEFSGLPKWGFKFMSVACGSAVELQDVFMTADDSEAFHCVLFDQDVRALHEAKEGIEQIIKTRGIHSKIDYLNESVRTMLRNQQLFERWGQFHFIYSLGLFDYLTPPVAKRVLKKLYDLLLPGGQLLIGNFHINNPNRYYMEYWMDWVVYYRTEEAFADLSNDIQGAESSVFYDETGIQMFLNVRKSA